MLRVLTNNFEFVRFKSYDIESSLDTLADGFTFTIGNEGGRNAGRIVAGQPVLIQEDFTRLMVGEIDTVEESDDIVVKGRDLMVSAIENDVEHREEETKIHPVKEIKRLAKEVGLFRHDTTGLPKGIEAIEKFTQEAGESVAEVMIRLAEAGGFDLWLDRLGVLRLSKHDFSGEAGWHFLNAPNRTNCDFIHRRQSAANLKTELWAFTEIRKKEDAIVKHTDQALIRAGLNRRKTLVDPDSKSREAAELKLKKLMNELKQRSKEWSLSYGGSHIRENEIPEPGKTALITSIYSDVERLKALIVSVTLKKDENGTRTNLVLRERP